MSPSGLKLGLAAPAVPATAWPPARSATFANQRVRLAYQAGVASGADLATTNAIWLPSRESAGSSDTLPAGTATGSPTPLAGAHNSRLLLADGARPPPRTTKIRSPPAQTSQDGSTSDVPRLTGAAPDRSVLINASPSASASLEYCGSIQYRRPFWSGHQGPTRMPSPAPARSTTTAWPAFGPATVRISSGDW